MSEYVITILCLSPIIVLSVVVYGLIKSGKIKKQPKTDWSKVDDLFKEVTNNLQNNKENITQCPKCGSENIKIYREGYNYNKGFWLRIFDIKGGGYIAGMNSNRARCHCLNCGKDWKTNYDYRFIEK